MLRERFSTGTLLATGKPWRVRRFRLLLWGMALLLTSAGCAVKSPPSREELRQQALAGIELPAEWRAGGWPGPVADNWLASFEDDRLAILVAEAVTRSPDLRISAVKVEQAAEYVNLAKATLLPALNILGTGGTKSGGGDATSALQGIAAVASWELDLWGRLRYGRNGAQESYVSTMADFEFACQSIAASTAKGWFTATETLLQQQIAEEMVRSAELLLALTEKRYEVGVTGQEDVALAQASLGTLRDSAAQVDLAHEQAIRALELLIGRYPTAELKVRRQLTKLPGPLPVGIPLELIERRPDLIAAERRVAAAFNRIGEAKAARLPKITLNASVAAFTSEAIQLKDDWKNPVSGAGARLLAPVYQGGALQTQVEIRTLEQKEAVAEYAAKALRALGDVENVLAAIENLARRQRLLQRNVVDQQRAFELVQTGYRTGTVDMRGVQQQLLDLHAARLNLLRVQSEQLSQRVNLHLALGGSFGADFGNRRQQALNQ
ncbi:MAG: hypothetical protein A2X81_16600 [Desulfobacterales bacterium GWB2_56_26]|nr:MAG: hypothetical protein A2X81_16600 [Desulfobacterales bacterium GWB2_56_26]